MAEGSVQFSLEKWTQRWEAGETGWQHGKVRDSIVKWYDKMTNKGELKRILVPLCGKTLDMIFFHERGHEVVGIEISYKACEEFFQENNIKFSVKVDANSGAEHILISDDSRITLYQGDMYAINKEYIKTFDAILDWNSFIAIDPAMREAYVSTLACLLKLNGRMLLNTFEYPREEYAGPPCAINLSEVEKIYAGKMKVELLEEITDGLEEYTSKFKLSKIAMLHFLLTKL